MMVNGRAWLRNLLLAGATLLPLTALAADPLAEARKLLAEGEAEAAHALLAPLLNERAGDPEYDYLLGLAALDSGRPTEAIFALERVLAVQPNHALARAEIARAYLAVGEIDTARETFEATREMEGVPQQARATIQRYLDIIDQAGAETARTRITGYVGFDMGYDSNVNAATADRRISIPAFGGLVLRLDDLGVEQEVYYGRLRGSVTVNHPLGARLRLLASATFDQRVNSDFRNFDQGNHTADVGLNWLVGKHSFTAAVQYYGFTLDRRRFRDAVGITGQWRYSASPDRNVGAYLQYADLRYPTQPVRDGSRVMLGGSWAEAFGRGRRHQAYAGLYGGTEDNDLNLDHLAFRFVGLRLGWTSYLRADWSVSLNLSGERRDYKRIEPLFLVTREDRWAEVRLGADYTGWKNWRVSPYLKWSDNRSNIVINRYDRWMIGMEVRREFR